MNMKKPLALLLAAGMTLGLAACGNGSQGNSESPAPGGETGGSSSGAVELNLWSFNVGGFAEASNWEPIIAAFNEQNPDIKITVTPINYQDGDQKLTSAITAGTGPDIIFEGPERIVGNYAREGLMVDLSDLWETGGSDIAEGISSVSQLDGTYYMYPLSVAAHCMAINYEAFEAAGALQYIDEETRTWTTDDFVAAMEAVKAAMDAGTVTDPKVGYVGAYPYAEVVCGYTAFLLGIQTQVPEAYMEVQYTNSWYDPVAEGEAANALMARGCVIIGQHADSTGAPSAVQAQKDAGSVVYSVGYNIDMLEVAPTAALTSSQNNCTGTPWRSSSPARKCPWTMPWASVRTL